MLSKRIGIQIDLNDSFWVQVEEAIYHALDDLDVIELVPIEVSDPMTSHLLNEQGGLVEELLTYDLQALICKDILPSHFPLLLAHQLPIIYLAETEVEHEGLVSPRGLYDTAQLVGKWLAEKLGGKGNILCVGGLVEPNADDGSSRLAGFCDALKPYPNLVYQHIPSVWSYSKAKEQIGEMMSRLSQPIDAIFGLSDTIAMAARNVAEEMGLLLPQTYVAGINGDPLALAAIAERQMTLTVETPAAEFGRKAIELAYHAACGELLPDHFSYHPRLITADNVNTMALKKLIAIADIPSRMVGVNRRQEHNRLIQLETSIEIGRRVGTLLDQQTLLQEISNLIRTRYEYDIVLVFLWSEAEQHFRLALPETPSSPGTDSPDLEWDSVLDEVVSTNAPIFIPDARTSLRFPLNRRWARTRSRIALPIQVGDDLIGILDLHSHRTAPHGRYELIGLQSLANQLGMAIRNAELYAEALEARARAERADQLKTRLLANVSHELRTPLNVIIGYAQTALASPNPYLGELPEPLRRDLGYINQSGQHLLHLINDLLGLSQAEIGALELFKETISTKVFLQDVFSTLSDTERKLDVIWHLKLPEFLPLLEADPMRLRQILINLLHNAAKFTNEGEIEFGAEVLLPYLHLWIRDTGIGIPRGMQEQIFEPFVKIDPPNQRQTGAGLGLTIVRRLVALHGGSITLESQAEQGSTFHLYLPLPSASGQVIANSEEQTESVLLLISNAEPPSPAITALCEQQKLQIQKLNLNDDINAIIREVHPAALAWDMSNVDLAAWKLFERLRAHPRIFQLPFIVYGQFQSEEPAITDVIMKPVSDKTLMGTLLALRPKTAQAPILIVDDDATARDLYRQLAAQALPGRTIQVAENGMQALALMEQTIPGLVILDLMMPEMDGFAVLEKMRSQNATQAIPVIILSGYLLTAEDMRRLDHRGVVFHSKEMLTDAEMVSVLQRGMGEVRGLSQPTSSLVKRALVYLHQNYADTNLSRQKLAQAINVSPQHLDRIFREELNLSVTKYLNRFRIQRAKELLLRTSDSITTIALRVGYNDAAYFNRVFRELASQSPGAYRKQDARDRSDQ
ncbi:MAG: helix-turn-helix domain-containing protein [Anaerolineae bacterium]|nr:helix-turn-helix domain-containing protein [Anaerolineae bacterium]